MKITLNRWQRILLAAGAIILLLVTYTQLQEEGFEGFGWVIPVALAVMFLALAVSGSPRKGQSKSISTSDVLQEFPSTNRSLLGAFNITKNHFGKHVRLQSHRLGLNEPGFVEQAGETRFKVYAYSFIIVVMSAYRLDPQFLESPRYRNFHKQISEKLKKAWLDSNRLETIHSKEDKNAYADTMLLITKIQTDIVTRLFNNSSSPFKPLFHYLATDTDRDHDVLVAELEKTTKDILRLIAKSSP